MNHEYSKVVSEGLRAAGSLVNVLKGDDGNMISEKFADLVPDLYNRVRSKLEKTDID